MHESEVKVKSLSQVRPSATPWTAAFQAPPSMGSSRQEYWSGVPLPSLLWRPTRPFRTNTQKRCPFHSRGLECKNRKSRNTWSNRQIWPWNTEWSKAKANRVLQENELVIANTFFQEHKRRLCTWTSPEGQYQNEIDYILCSQRWRSSIEPAKTRPEADCELLIAKFRIKLKKVGKTSRPFH